MVEFRVLGSIDVVDAGKPCVIPSERQRVLLGALVLHVGRVVPADRLIDAVWGESPPASARATLRTHIAQLRRALGPDGPDVLATEPPGYVLRVEPDRVDAVRFQRLAAEGHDLLRVDPAQAAERLGQALDLWRGDPLGEIATETFAEAAVARLTAQRWGAIEDHAEAQLALGLHTQLVSDLEALVAEQPLRERLWEYLMLALYRCGRQAEALRAFQTARRVLAEELGVDPSPRLRQLEDQMLRHDPALDVEAAAQGPGPPPPLPTGVVTFLLTDVEASTRAWRERGPGVLVSLRAITDTIARAVGANGGVLLKARGEGDSTFSVFSRPTDGIAAALEMQRELEERAGAEGSPLRVRIGVHSGQADLDDGDYAGLEVARAARLRDAAHGGQVVVSGATADLVEDRLPPDASLVALGDLRLKDFDDRAQPVYQLMHPGLRRVFPPLRVAAAPPELPVPLTELLGRHRELVEVRALLGDGRLVTVVGPGGSGKTRLALEVALGALDRYRDGVVLVDLAPVSDPSTVLPVIAAALGVRDASGRNLETQLHGRARPLEMLLILDNCEHVLVVVAELVAALLPAAPSMSILATSRQRLGIPGERSYPLTPLPTPRADDTTPAAVGAWPAAELFVSRARAVDPGFGLTADNAAVIAQICRQLDGIPLALELAAAAVRSLGVDEIAGSLDRLLDSLTPDATVRPPRHQTLAALIGWSFDLLSASDRQLFSRLSVFAGGFGVASAHAVCGDHASAEESTAAGLVRLVERSLIVPEHRRSGARFRMLDTIRAYADGRLSERERARARGRHLAWAMDLASTADAQLRGPEPGPGLSRLEQELDNIRQAIDWGLSDGDPSRGVRLANVMSRFWAMRGRITEGRQSLERARARIDDVPPATRGRWYLAAGALACVGGSLHAARESLERAVELLEACNDRDGAAQALFTLGHLERMAGRAEAAERMYEDGLRLAESIGAAHHVATGKAGLGDIACARGDYEHARNLYEDVLESFQASGEVHAVANAQLNLAAANKGLGRHDAALKHCGEAEEIFRRLEDRSCRSAALEMMAEVAATTGDGTRAATLYTEALGMRADLQQRAPLAVPLDGLGLELAARARWAPAVTVLSAADGLRAEEGLPRDPDAQARHDQVMERAKAALGTEAFDAARSVGREQSLAKTVVLALEQRP